MYIYRSIMFGGRMILYHGSEHRIEKPQFGKEAVAYLKENFSLPYHDADIIIGYRADDSYFSYASDFINNIISLQTLAKAMQLGNLGEQIVVKSELAFSKLQFIGAEKVLSEEWYGAKFERDRQARKKYQEMRNEPWTKGNIYMMALLEQEVKADDERIRL